MAGLPLPTDDRVTPEAPFSFGDPWRRFFAALSRKLNATAAVLPVSTADAGDAATTQALVNELKAKINEILAAQKL